MCCDKWKQHKLKADVTQLLGLFLNIKTGDGLKVGEISLIEMNVLSILYCHLTVGLQTLRPVWTAFYWRKEESFKVILWYTQRGGIFVGDSGPSFDCPPKCWISHKGNGIHIFVGATFWVYVIIIFSRYKCFYFLNLFLNIS